MKLIPIVALSGAILLAGCSSFTDKSRYSAPPLPAPEYTQGELNHESLYELLVAELSGQHGLFPQALAGYKRQAALTGDPGVAERATRIAQYMRQPDEVLESARLWIKSAPDDAEPYQAAAGVLLHRGQYNDALPLLEQALQNNQAQTLALIDTRVGQMPDAAVTAYQQLISQQLLSHPRSADLHRSNGVLLRKLGQNDAALIAFNKARKLAPEQLDVMVQKADLLRSDGNTQAALKTVAAGLKQYPKNRQLKLLHAQLLFDTNNVGEATQTALTLIDGNPNDHQLHLYLALLMLDADQRDEAGHVLKDLLRTRPTDTTPHFYLGHLAEKQGESEAAIRHFLSVNGGPKLFPAFARISTLLDSAEHQQRLQQITQDGRSRYPQIGLQLYVMEAEWLHSYDLTDTALAILEDALAAFPDNTHLLYTRAMLIESSDFVQAETDLRKIIGNEPDNALALNALGYLMTIHTERYQEALQLIQKALQLNPDDPATLDSMGWVLFRLNRSNDALPFLEKAYELLPEPEVSSHLVEVYYALGQTERARALLKKGLQANPDSSHLQDIAEKLSL